MEFDKHLKQIKERCAENPDYGMYYADSPDGKQKNSLFNVPFHASYCNPRNAAHFRGTSLDAGMKNVVALFKQHYQFAKARKKEEEFFNYVGWTDHSIESRLINLQRWICELLGLDDAMEKFLTDYKTDLGISDKDDPENEHYRTIMNVEAIRDYIIMKFGNVQLKDETLVKDPGNETAIEWYLKNILLFDTEAEVFEAKKANKP